MWESVEGVWEGVILRVFESGACGWGESLLFWNLPANIQRVGNPLRFVHVSILLLLEFARQLRRLYSRAKPPLCFNPSSSGICPPTHGGGDVDNEVRRFQSFFFWNLPANKSLTSGRRFDGRVSILLLLEFARQPFRVYLQYIIRMLFQSFFFWNLPANLWCTANSHLSEL